jgi:uncharacterized protein YbaR (Trm112 family)
MVDPELLEILVCPETKTAVRLAERALLDRVNLELAEGRLTTRGGKAVGEKLEAGLIREDGLLLYPIRDGIPVMLIDEAIPLDALR